MVTTLYWLCVDGAPDYLAVRQCLPKSNCPSAGNLGVQQAQRVKLAQPFNVNQCGVCNLGARQVKLSELGMPLR